MKSPNWALPLVIVAFVVVRVFVASRFRKAEREKTGKGWFESIPKPIFVFWLILGIAVVTLAFWNPGKPISAHPSPSTDPAPASGVSPAGDGSRHP